MFWKIKANCFTIHVFDRWNVRFPESAFNKAKKKRTFANVTCSKDSHSVVPIIFYRAHLENYYSNYAKVCQRKQKTEHLSSAASRGLGGLISKFRSHEGLSFQ
ncbi:unnamed protein product, partial [Owenia fusiformis]